MTTNNPEAKFNAEIELEKLKAAQKASTGTTTYTSGATNALWPGLKKVYEESYKVYPGSWKGVYPSSSPSITTVSTMPLVDPAEESPFEDMKQALYLARMNGATDEEMAKIIASYGKKLINHADRYLHALGVK